MIVEEYYFLYSTVEIIQLILIFRLLATLISLPVDIIVL